MSLQRRPSFPRRLTPRSVLEQIIERPSFPPIVPFGLDRRDLRACDPVKRGSYTQPRAGLHDRQEHRVGGTHRCCVGWRII